MSMTAEIISVGTELLLGNILNTNAQYLSRELAELGITVRRQSTIGDNHGRLADFVNEAKQRCDLLVFTGGLGPTADDLTKETVAACFGDTLTFDPEEWQKIVDFFTRTGRETTPNNRKQAMVPVLGHKVVNHHGTAPGAWFEQDGHCAVLMPGVPHEMKAMWEESVRPLLLARQSYALHSLTLRVLGGESNLEYRVRALLENPNPTAAIYCKTGECEIRITARAQNDAEAQTMCRAYAKKFYDLLGDAVYDEDVAGLEETVVHTLQANGLTIATAESCTGGMIAQRLTSVSGASEVFGYGFVTYWEQAKAKLVGVDPAVIAQYNVVSAPVAAQMALGAAKAAGADLLVTHHPMIFSPVSRITDEDFIGRRLLRMIRADMAYYAMHTNYDVLRMSELSGEYLGLSDARVLEVTCETPKTEGIGRVADLPDPVSLQDYCETVKKAFGLQTVQAFGDLAGAVKRIAVSPGSGKSMIDPAIAMGADVLVTGDIGHHEGIDAVARGLAVIDAGHYGIEHIFIKDMKQFLERSFAGVEVITAPRKDPFTVL